MTISANAASTAKWQAMPGTCGPTSTGKRFMDETRSYQHGYGRDALFYNDSAKMEWPRLPFWQVVDESTLPFMGTSGSGWVHIVGGTSAPDSTEELLSSGLMVKADTVEELASQMGVEATILQESVDALSGPDDEFGRAAEKKRALSGTLYAVQLQPIMVNTNGGPSAMRVRASCIRTARLSSGCSPLASSAPYGLGTTRCRQRERMHGVRPASGRRNALR